MNPRRIAEAAAAAALLFAFWLAMSGMLEPFLVFAGLGVSLSVAAVALRIGGIDPEGAPWRFAAAVPTYWPWLLKEMLVSGGRVARIILDPRLPISPGFVRFCPSQRTSVGLATHANSITLTPGTIAVAAREGEFLVHALTREAGTGLAGSEMDRRVRRLEGV